MLDMNTGAVVLLRTNCWNADMYPQSPVIPATLLPSNHLIADSIFDSTLLLILPLIAMSTVNPVTVLNITW